MQDSSLSVSVIIPVFNGEKFLATAIHNVKSQTYPVSEIIVIDDGSTDSTADVAAQFQHVIRYFYQPNHGPAAARNKGIQIAQSDFIAFLDVDDLWPENSLELQVSYLIEHPAVEIVSGMIQEVRINQTVDNSNQQTTSSANKTVYSNPYYFVNIGSSIYRKTAFDKVGLFDESLKYGEDTDWLVRAWEKQVSKHSIDEVTLFYQKHWSNMTAGKDLIELGLVKVFKKHIERSRKQANGTESFSANSGNLIEYIGKRKNPLKNSDFTIISNDCWGGTAYQSMGLIYRTPLVGTRILPPCYLKLLRNLRGYLKSPLTFTDHSRYDSVNQEREHKAFPIGLLKEDIEIHFYHEISETKAKQNWEKRLDRINWDNIFIKFSDGEVAWDGDYLPYIQEFEMIDLPYKICFTSKKYPNFSTTLFIPDFVPDGNKMFYISQKHFDVVSWLDKRFDNKIQNYIR